MKKSYRIRVTKPDGEKALHWISFTSKKKAEEFCIEWNKAMPNYLHEVMEERDARLFTRIND